jgi:hypothetical protein
MKSEMTLHRFELHICGNVLHGTRKELEDFIKYVEGDYQIYEIIPSAGNMIEVTERTSISIIQYMEIYKLCQSPMSKYVIAHQYHLGSDAVIKIAKDYFQILNKK